MEPAVQHRLRVVCFVNNHGTIYSRQSQMRKYCKKLKLIYRTDHWLPRRQTLSHDGAKNQAKGYDSTHMKNAETG